jgi:hypothetical protein
MFRNSRSYKSLVEGKSIIRSETEEPSKGRIGDRQGCKVAAARRQPREQTSTAVRGGNKP